MSVPREIGRGGIPLFVPHCLLTSLIHLRGQFGSRLPGREVQITDGTLLSRVRAQGFCCGNDRLAYPDDRALVAGLTLMETLPIISVAVEPLDFMIAKVEQGKTPDHFPDEITSYK